ncbi:hypothetical protein hmeg3_09625 [Herbaspirillum sp. meg3]|uniref:hypothetical protein n=1 Tax=Herbaspirillum sp. meg3 TaxID=2025949 RepID=UPI000B98FA1E|nr:hypothetical protein [Herbaspirillum sp. meg3]ASU38530.1 hypothetical protein hmeg3_09625 [Herbaspirillum sp. meg3]
MNAAEPVKVHTQFQAMVNITEKPDMGKLIAAILRLFKPAPPPASPEPLELSAEASGFYDAFARRLVEVTPPEVLAQPGTLILNETIAAVLDELVRSEKHHARAVRYRSCWTPV